MKATTIAMREFLVIPLLLAASIGVASAKLPSGTPDPVDPSVITGQNVPEPVVSWRTPDGPFIVEHLAGRSAVGDLLVFWWTPATENWRVVNVSQITGQQIAGLLTSWQTWDGTFNVEHLAGASPTGDLLVFWWTPATDWQVVNVSQITGQQIAGPLTSWQSSDGIFNVEHLAGASPTGDLLLFSWTPATDWRVVNVSQMTGQKITGPVTNWLASDIEYLEGQSPSGELLVFFRSPRADWQVMTVTTRVPMESQLPTNWAQQEVEAKWNVSSEAFLSLRNRLLNAGLTGGEWQGYRLVTRWSGRPKLFVDYYYDSNESLSSTNRVLRHRTRWQTRDALNPSDDITVFRNANWDQKEDERIQFKSVPARFNEIWFRAEYGNECYLSGDRPLCPSTNASGILRGDQPHPATQAMLREVSYTPSDARSDLVVLDWRQRVELHKDGQAIYEISFDQVDSLVRLPLCTFDGSQARCWRQDTHHKEIEIEIVKGNYTYGDVRELFRVSDQLFFEGVAAPSLVPVSTSKGGATMGNAFDRP
jgi:hypothetical protein